MTAHELYERIVGEGGLSPDYFMHHMTVAEASSFLRGQDRRHRQGWEQSRLLGGLVHKVLTGADWHPAFPWDDEYKEDDEQTDAEDLKALRAIGRQMQDMVNAKGNL